jgi:hypothetical protein
MNRMKDIRIDPADWTAVVGAGVTAWELQREALRHGMRANTAEPSATVCGNVICTGLFSTWSACYGTMADNVIDMEFVGRDGEIFHLSDPDAPNLAAYEHRVKPPPGICTKAVVPLHPVTEDEEAFLIPFGDFGEAVRLARELNVHRVGLAIAVLGPHYLANFMSPSGDLAEKLKKCLAEDLGMEYAVYVITDAFGAAALRKMADHVIDGELLRKIILGLPRLLDREVNDLLAGMRGESPLYETLCRPELGPLLDTLLDPSPETAASSVESDMRAFYASLYADPAYTDGVWLNAQRIVSPRMGRRKHVFAFLVYLPADGVALMRRIIARFEKTAGETGLDHDFGFITPMDLGKRAVLEYDCWIDHTLPDDRERAARLMESIVPWLDELAVKETGVTWIKTFFSQGCVRKESFFYRGFRQRTGA